jgi:PAS domain S-box-containing protein
MEVKGEPTPFDQKLFFIFIVTFASMLAFEFIAQFLYPYLPDWRSNLITSLFVSGLAVIIAYFPLNSYYSSNVKLVSEMERRRCAETELRESEDFNRGLVENMPDMVMVYGHDRKIRFMNPAVKKMLGYSMEEQPGADIMDFVVPEQRGEIARIIAERLTTGNTKSVEVDIMGKEGKRLTVITQGTVVRYHKEPAVLLVLNDITERKRADELVRRANKKLNLLHGITRHDINNQLLALDGYIGLLHEKVVDSLYKDFFSRIMEASNRIAAIIRFTKEYEEIGVNSAVWQGLRALVDTAGSGATLGTVTLKNDLPADAEVRADPLIVKVFFNLMDNSLRHGNGITTIRFSCNECNGKPIIVCEDDGCGVACDKKEKIFERGFGNNTGFGLSLSREILETTGMTIREVGEPGRGARFEITVPAGAYRSSYQQKN